jgi:hypothetical protein
MKNTSKEQINNRVVEPINNSVEIHRMYPNKFNMERPIKESQVEKSLVAKITDIKNVTIRRNSRNTKELQHTDNKIFCGGIDEIQGKGT